MTKISVMRDNFERTAWKRAFAERLMALRPDMNPDAVDEVSDRQVAEVHGLDPAHAAEQWMKGQTASPRDDDEPAVSAG